MFVYNRISLEWSSVSIYVIDNNFGWAKGYHLLLKTSHGMLQFPSFDWLTGHGI